MRWETDWQVLGGYFGRTALHLINDLRQERAPHADEQQGGPSAPRSRRQPMT